MARSLIGPKVRDRRRALGITQAAVAAQVGISASYLNLIESNKRNIGGALLKKLADALGLSIDELDGAAERRLLGDLGELAGEPVLAGLRLDRASADDLASRHVSWARALITLHRAWLDRGQAVAALSDRLSHDPFLGDAVHDMLTKVAAIRSSAEILEAVDDLDDTQRRRFASIVGGESRRLSDVAQALAAFFDAAQSSTRSITPVEEVDDLLSERENHFPALEAAAERIRHDARIEGRISAERLFEWTGPGEGLPGTGSAPLATVRFERARAAAAKLAHEPIEAEVAGSRQLTSDAARRRARRVLAAYTGAALLMPYAEFLDEARRCRYDIDELCQRFTASFEQVAHRLTTLRRPGEEGIAFGFMRVDPAGFVTKRLPIPGMLLPRHGNACPLWAAYQAFQDPGGTVRQLVEFPSGERFFLVARAVEKPRPAFGLPRRLYSVMLACRALHADALAYGEGLDLASTARAVPVGASCRICPRRECAWREEDPIIDA